MVVKFICQLGTGRAGRFDAWSEKVTRKRPGAILLSSAGSSGRKSFDDSGRSASSNPGGSIFIHAGDKEVSGKCGSHSWRRFRRRGSVDIVSGAGIGSVSGMVSMRSSNSTTSSGSGDVNVGGNSQGILEVSRLPLENRAEEPGVTFKSRLERARGAKEADLCWSRK